MKKKILTSLGSGGCEVEVSAAHCEATDSLFLAFLEVDVVLAFSGWNSLNIDS